MDSSSSPSAAVIGISCGSIHTPSAQAIAEQVRRGSALPVLLCDHHTRSPENDFGQMDALIVMGNDFDIDPHSYIDRYPQDDIRRHIHPQTRSELSTPEGQARAEYEEALMRMALESGMPLLGICGGMQRLNVLCGGTLHQHIPEMTGTDKHMQHTLGIEPTIPVIPIIILEGTILASIAADIEMPPFVSRKASCAKVISENSMHHQAIDIIAPGLRACCLTDAFPRPDGTIDYMTEGIEADPNGVYRNQFLLGVQWHPEFGASNLGSRIINHLIAEALAFIANDKTVSPRP